MSMFKRPSQRVRCPPPIRGDKPKEGTHLYGIITNKHTKVFKFVKQPVYMQESYLKALKVHYQKLGIPYTEPTFPELTHRPVPKQMNEPKLEFGDRIQVVLRVLKNGTVRVKVNGAIATMYEKYYHKGTQAPFKVVLQAYKAHGFSKEFLEKIKKSNDKKIEFTKKVPGILTKIFDKEPTKKAKKKKEEKKIEDAVITDELPEEEELEEDHVPVEEGELDVEPDEEDVVDDEEYISDPET